MPVDQWLQVNGPKILAAMVGGELGLLSGTDILLATSRRYKRRIPSAAVRWAIAGSAVLALLFWTTALVYPGVNDASEVQTWLSICGTLYALCAALLWCLLRLYRWLVHQTALDPRRAARREFGYTALLCIPSSLLIYAVLIQDPRFATSTQLKTIIIATASVVGLSFGLLVRFVIARRPPPS
jgi:hypothetical protein